jgi:hypothetical protein
MLPNRKAYEDKLEAQHAQWRADIAAFKAGAKRAEVDAMMGYDQAIEALQRKHEEAGQNLGNLKAATDEAWENVKTGTEKVWLELKLLLHSAPVKA